VLDTTGSMSGLIEGAKRKIWSIANQLASGQPRPVVRLALVAYRDRGDTYVTRVHELTDDIDAVYADLQQLAADGGGDTPESVNQALHEAVTRLAWSSDKNVYRAVFLVGDAPPHLDYPGDVPFSRSVALAREKDIAINTVQCGDYAETTPIWQQIASSGGGTFAAISQDGGMLALAAPMDDELARLNADLAGTLVPLRRAGRAGRARGEARSRREGGARGGGIEARLLLQARRKAQLGARRLLDAIASGTKKLADVARRTCRPHCRHCPRPRARSS
jgi:hypothetical protein